MTQINESRARQGLHQDVFQLVSSLTPLINVDLLIKNTQHQTLLTWRHDAFYGPGWHIPGGIIRFKERWEDRIIAVAKHELGAQVSFAPQPVGIRQIMNSSRDIRGHFISLLFRCNLESAPDEILRATESPPRSGQWAWHSMCPDNIIAVHEMYREDINCAHNSE